MGSYLVVDGKKNNTKSISYPMITLLREVLPDKKSLSGEEIFTLTKKEVSIILYNVSELLSDNDLFKKYIEKHSENYGMNESFEDIKDAFEWIQMCFAKTLSEMTIEDKRFICCEWE